MAARQRCVFPWQGGGDDNSEWSRGKAAKAADGGATCSALFEVRIRVAPLISANVFRFVDIELFANVNNPSRLQ